MNTIHKKNIDAYSSLYKTDAAAHSYEVRVKVEMLTKLIPKKIKMHHLLEIGYGTGDMLHQLASTYKNASVVGIEVVDEAKKLYKKRYPSDKNVNLLTKDGESKLHLPKATFDLIVASHVLEHIEQESDFLEQVYNSLNKNGIFALAVPDWGDFENHLHYRQYDKRVLEEIGKRFAWQQLMVKGDGFYLNKLFYRLLWMIPAYKVVNTESVSNSSGHGSSVTLFIKNLYYTFGVNMLLQMNKLDSLLFSHIDNKPMQWIVFYRKR